jgi:MYXO-CTERM domain-containing protein
MRVLLILSALAFGAGLAAQGQEIVVERNGNNVADGGTVNLGDVDVLETTQVDFTIRNTGTTDLMLTGGVAVTDEDNCSTTVQQPGLTTIPAGGSTTFQVHVTNDGDGNFSCDVSIPNNDADEASFAFQIQGTAVADDDDDDDDDDDCSTSGGTGGAMMIAGLAAIGALALRRRKLRA